MMKPIKERENTGSLLLPKNIETEQPILGAVVLDENPNRVNEKKDLTRDIEQALEDRFEELVEHLCGEPKTRTRREWRYGRKSSLSISMGGSARGKWKDFEADEGGGPLQLIMRERGLSWHEAIEWAKDFIGPGYSPLPPLPRKVKPTSDSDVDKRRKKIEKAQAIAAESDPVFETPGDYYLRRRGITASLPESIRYQVNAWGKYGALVAVATDAEGNVQAVQQIYVDGDQKAPLDVKKRTNGVLGGAAVKFPPRKPGGPVVLAEGVETGLSVWQATGYETWIFFGVGNVGKCEIPPGRPIIIARDGDEPGSPADETILKAIQSLLERGVDVSVATPPLEQDFNDVLQIDGWKAVRVAIEDAEPQEGIKPYFDSDPLPIIDAQVVLPCMVDKWFDDAIANSEIPVQKAIKAAAGLGKTEEYIKVLSQRDNIQNLIVEIYVPTHKLVDELLNRLKNKAPDLKVRPIRGREYKEGTPEAVCKKADLAKDIGRLSLPVQSTLCLHKDGIEAYEHFDECPYQKQFQNNGPEIRILVHEYLTINRISGASAPDLTIIDEKFWPSALEKTSFGIDRLNSQGKIPDYIRALSQRVQSAMEQGEPVKRALKEIGVTDSELRDAARAARADIEAISISPGMDVDTQRRLIKKAKPREALKAWRMWHLMAEEFELPGDEFVRVQYKRDVLVGGENQNRIFLYWRKKLRIRENHVLVLDADANEEILKPFLPGIKVSKIDVEWNAEVIQVVDTPCSNWKLLADKPDEAAKLAARSLGDVQALIDRKSNIASLNLVVATKKIAERLKAPDGCEIAWFGSLLGVDIWKDLYSAIIVGREQAPPDAYEEQGRALWWDQELIFIESDEYGNRLLSKEKRAYRMRDGSIQTVKVEVHPDPRIQMLVEQGREAQSAQAFDRLRLIHNDMPKRVFILSNIPLDVTVDKLVTWRDMVASPVQHALSRYGVLPLSYNELARVFPDIWPSPAAAKEQLKRQKLNRNDSLIIYLLENRSYLILVNYRRPGQRGKLTKALISLDKPDPRAALEAVVGEVGYFEFDKFCDQRGDIPVHVAEDEIRDPLELSVFGGLGACDISRIRGLPDDSGFNASK